MEYNCITCHDELPPDYINRGECESCENLRVAVKKVSIETVCKIYMEIFCEVINNKVSIDTKPNNIIDGHSTNFIQTSGDKDALNLDSQDRRYAIVGKDEFYDEDFFIKIFEKQLELQTAMGYPLGQGEAGFKEAILALIVEATEALGEVNWKPWKQTRKEVDHHKLATEMTDILQFWVNAALIMNLTPDDLMQALTFKWEVNKKRIEEGY